MNNLYKYLIIMIYIQSCENDVDEEFMNIIKFGLDPKDLGALISELYLEDKKIKGTN